MGSSFNCMFSQHCVRRVSSLGGTSGHDGFDLGLGFARLKGGTDDGVRDVLRGLSLEHIGGGLETELLSKSNKLANSLILRSDFDGGGGGDDGEEESGLV